MAHTEKSPPSTLHISPKGQGLAQRIVLVIYLSHFIHKAKAKCSKQKLTSCAISVILDFLAGFVHDKDKAVQCDLCELWIHIKCNNLNHLDYRYLQNFNESWYSTECGSTIFPVNSLSSNKIFLTCCTSTESNIIQWKDLGNVMIVHYY